jgi:hypothetical protein
MITWGYVVSYSDKVVVDDYFTINGQTLTSYYIYAGTGGNIVWENAYGNAQYLEDVVAGAFYPIGARRILASGTVNGINRTTSATDLVWLAGNKAV